MEMELIHQDSGGKSIYDATVTQPWDQSDWRALLSINTLSLGRAVRDLYSTEVHPWQSSVFGDCSELDPIWLESIEFHVSDSTHWWRVSTVSLCKTLSFCSS